MPQASDIVAIGSGHNGLVAAAYLAAAGKRVTVLERNAWFGGGCVTRELTVPGFRHDQHSMSHIFIQANPLLKNDDLGLKSKYGLRYVYPETPMMSVFKDGRTLGVHRDPQRTAADIRQFSATDAEAFLKVSQQGAAWLPMITASLYAPPMPLGPTYAMMDQSREGRELWRVMQMSSHDLLCETFESPEVRMHFARVAGENLVSPDEKSTGIGMFVFVAFLEAYGIGVPVGGSGELTRALIDFIEDHGGQVLADRTVDRVLVKNGRAAGAVTTSGEEFHANDGVIGAIHPHHLRRMVEGLDPEVARMAERTQITDAACITIHAALDRPLTFKAGEHVRAAMIELLPDTYDELRKCFDDLRYGQFVRTPLVGLGSLTMFDPSRVPEGKAVLHAWDYVPYDRPDGRSWDETKRDYAERMLAQMRHYVDDIDIIDMHIDSPVDMERTSPSFFRGDLHGVAQTTYQYGAHRPTPELGQNTVPGIDRLYLVGPFQAPGGGVFGAGRATAIRMCEDLKLNFDKAVARA